MRKQLGDRLPHFTPEEAALVKGSNDFYGMNHYCANYIRHRDTEPELDDHAGNLDVLYQNKKGEWIGPETQSVWLRPMPLGFRKLIKWLSDRYGGPTFYVTENGTSLKGENDLPLDQLLDDEFRCEYFRGYIGALADAHTLDGVDVRGYSAWSLMEYVNSFPFSFVASLQPTPPLHLRPVLAFFFLGAYGMKTKNCPHMLARIGIGWFLGARRIFSPSSETHESFPLPAAGTENPELVLTFYSSVCVAILSGPRATRRDSASPTLTTRAARSDTRRRAHARSRKSLTSISKRSRVVHAERMWRMTVYPGALATESE